MIPSAAATASAAIVLDVRGPLGIRALGPEAPDEHDRAGHVGEHRQARGQHAEAVLGDPGADRDRAGDEPEADRDPGEPQRTLEQRRAAVLIGAARGLGASDRCTCTGAHASASSWAPTSTVRIFSTISSSTLVVGDQRRRDLQDRVAAVVGARDQPRLEQRRGHEAAQQASRARRRRSACSSSSVTSSTAQKKPAPRTSPTIGRSLLELAPAGP